MSEVLVIEEIPCENGDGMIAKVTINRPDKLNALNQDVTSSIKEMCKWAEENDSIRCVVITGAKPNPPPEGKRAKPHAFVAGADITEFVGKGSEEIRELLTSYKFPGDKTPIIKGSALAAVEGKDEAIGKNSIMELMKAVDEHIPQPDRPKDKPFLMPVEDVFSISGRGTVVTGRVEQGVVKTGEEIEIVGIRETKKSVCTGVEMFRKILDTGEAGDNIGALLRGVERTDVERGQVLAKPGSVTPHTEFEAQAYVLKKEEGGRHTPFFTKYRPQFYFRTTDVTGEVELPSGTEMVMPGDDAKFKVKLITPIAMSEKLNFAIREGGRTVGAGVVTKIIK